MDKKPLSEFLETGRGERKIAFSSCFPLASSLLRGPDRQQERPELASPLCDLFRHFRHPKKGPIRSGEEAARGSRTVSDSDTQPRRPPRGLQKSMRVSAPDRSSPILCTECPFAGQNITPLPARLYKPLSQPLRFPALRCFHRNSLRTG